MSLDPLLPIAPARVKALLLPVGKIRADRFASFVERLQSENVVYLRDITADSRPNRSKSLMASTACLAAVRGLDTAPPSLNPMLTSE